MDLESHPVWAAHVAVMRATLNTRTTEPVDVVFSSEAYGPELARRFNATHVMVDPAPAIQGVSGTAARHDLAGSWDLLHPVVRAGMTTRVVVLGAESTGTTTISQRLAEAYRERGGVWARTQWVPEYGREHTMLKHDAACSEAARRGHPAPALENLVWDSDDFGFIAQRQAALEEAAARHGSPVLICDTDALATRVWERRYVYQGAQAAADAVPTLPARAIYLLTDHVGVPFVQDGWRDGEHVRAKMTGYFIDELTTGGHSWALLTGSLGQRMDLARRITDEALHDAAELADPIGVGRSSPAPTSH
jgi:NadR type nicotinamide-nucleotide adenylyltransferase